MIIVSRTELDRMQPIAEELGLDLVVVDEDDFPSTVSLTSLFVLNQLQIDQASHHNLKAANFGDENYLDKSALIIYTRFFFISTHANLKENELKGFQTQPTE